MKVIVLWRSLDVALLEGKLQPTMWKVILHPQAILITSNQRNVPETLNALKYPSASRIAARNKPTQQPTTTVKSSIHTRSKTNDDAYVASENGNTIDSEYESMGENTGTESETNETGTELLPSSNSATKKKGSFETTTCGIPIRKRNRKFYCTGCEQVEQSLAALNEHFRNTLLPGAMPYLWQTF